MSSTTTASVSATLREALERVITDLVTPSAMQVDRDGAFSSENIHALGSAGVLGLLSATDVGGGGLGLREAAEVVERLAGACGSTAMACAATAQLRCPRQASRCQARPCSARTAAD